MGGERSSTEGWAVFAVEDRALQLTWRGLRPGTTAVRLGDDVRDLTDAPPAGSLTFEGLEPDRELTAVVTGPDGEGRLTARTLSSPPGEELFRFATVSDIHIGIDHFDFFRRIQEDLADDEEPHPLRCTRAALRELAAWGAERVVVKGDLTEESFADQWTEVGDLLRTPTIPVDVMPGNHDYETAAGGVGVDIGTDLARLRLHRGVEHTDVPGARLVFVDTPVPGRHLGTLPPERIQAVADAVRDVPTAIVLLHHQLQTTWLPLYWPPGVPYRQTRDFLAALAGASDRVLVTSGHTHRHRRRDVGTTVVTEVGSPKDYPGTWAGYVVHEGGVRQVVRRVEAPECATWLERTRTAALGMWGRWSIGGLSDRCFSHAWPS
jgi:3',5'-cyclic-AMP phosphodiesterase